ncbi:MAG: hypothetical protein DWI58_11645, partial [Chloroflexi bacterium]
AWQREAHVVALTEPAIERIVSALSRRGIQAIVFYPRPLGLTATPNAADDRPPLGTPSIN